MNRLNKLFSNNFKEYVKSDKFEKKRFKISFKISRILKDRFEKITHKYTRVRLFKEALKKSDLHHKYKINKIKKLIDKGNFISGYIPYIKDQTKAIVYNYFSTCYGLRSNGYLLIFLVDKDFNLICSKLLDFNFRDSLIIDVDAEFKAKNTQASSFFIALQINNRIPKNHGTNLWVKAGGSMRFWGAWNDHSALTHSLFMPHPTKFFRKIINFQNGKYLERMNYSEVAKKIYHYAPFSKNKLIEKKGDLSGEIRLEPGYTICLDKKNLVKSSFHQSQLFSRINRQEAKFKKIKHVIALPPNIDIDLELFFGECCTNNSKFKVTFWSYLKDFTVSKEYEKEIYLKDIRRSLFLSDIFDFTPSNNGSWITFEALSGKHHTNYINHIYQSKDKKNIYDAVHSHTFTTKNTFGRTLKFCPIKFNIKDPNNLEIETYIAIFGHSSKDVNFRLRLFDINENNIEMIETSKVFSNQIKFIKISDCILKFKKEKSHNNISDSFSNGICQIECDEANLNCNCYIIKKKSGYIESIAVDHLTGG